MSPAPAGAPPIDAAARPAARRAPRRRLFALAAALPIGLIVAEIALRALGGDVVDAPEPGPYAFGLVRTMDGAPLLPTDGPLALELNAATLFRLRPRATSSAFRINSAGDRGPEPRPRRAGVRRILLCGASTPFGFNLAADEETIAARLASRLPDAEVVNLGVPWFMSGQTLCQLVTRAEELRPDVVVYLDGWTDCMDWWHFPPRPSEDYGFNNHVRRVIEERLFERELAVRDPWFMIRAGCEAAWESTAIRRAIRRRSETTIPAPSAAPDAPRVYDPEISADVREASYVAMRDRFVGHTVAMREWAEGRGVRFVFALQPELTAKTRRTEREESLLRGDARIAAGFPGAWERFKREVLAATAARGVTSFDLGADPALRDAPEEHYSDIVHPNATGADRIAEALAPHLR